MKIIRAFVFLAAVLLIISLAACVRPVPGSEETTPTTEGLALGQIPGATDAMGQIYIFATQTAMAAQGGTPGALLIAETPEAPIAIEETPALTTESQPTEPSQAPAQPTAPSIDIPAPTPGIPSSYTLKGGEFPYCIARRFNVNPGELLNLNGLTSFSVYYSGMTLRIPQTGSPFPGNRSLRPHPATYTIRAGDSIYKIACVYGDVSPDAIVLANGLTPPYNLTPGQILNIP